MTVAPDGAIWVAGEAGTILTSADGGSWEDPSVPRCGDLYAVAFPDGGVGMAVGAHGAALLTEDGGASWEAVPTGLDGFLGDVVFLDDGHALAVGEAGAALVHGL